MMNKELRTLDEILPNLSEDERKVLDSFIFRCWLDDTNIDATEDEVKVLDSFLHRCWQTEKEGE